MASEPCESLVGQKQEPDWPNIPLGELEVLFLVPATAVPVSRRGVEEEQ